MSIFMSTTEWQAYESPHVNRHKQKWHSNKQLATLCVDLYAERCGNDTKAVAHCEKRQAFVRHTKWEIYGQIEKTWSPYKRPSQVFLRQVDSCGRTVALQRWVHSSKWELEGGGKWAATGGGMLMLQPVNAYMNIYECSGVYHRRYLVRVIKMKLTMQCA